MARTTYVKKAQARYETKPVLDDQGNPVKIALTRKDGKPKMTAAKRGREPRPILITKTEPDKTRPKPNHKCGKCGVEIQVGDPYKWIKPKSGPYGGRLMVRCGKCPTWNVWDYSSSLSAQVARIDHDATQAVFGAESTDDVTAILEQAAQEIRDLAEGKRESASNIEDGFGHATYQSEELESLADELDGWADEVESTDVPEQDDYLDEDEVECGECGGLGEVENDDYDQDEADTDPTYAEDENVPCPECHGNGTVENDDPEVDLDSWRDAVADAVADALGNCPA